MVNIHERRLLLYVSPLRLVFLLVVVLLSFSVRAGNDTEDSLVKKIYVHTDRNLYLAGELAWFAIYSVTGPGHMLNTDDRISYIELIDQHNKVVVQQKIALEAGRGRGSFPLPADMVSGNYLLRCYTAYMKNYGPGRYFEKQLTVINTLKPYQGNLKAEDSADVQFFPEGGVLLSGYPSRVAFKITNPAGSGVSARGHLISSTGDTVTTLETFKFGMGNVVFTPAPNEVYTAHLYLESGRTIRKRISPVAKAGYAFYAERSADSWQITIHASLQSTHEAQVVVQSGLQTLSKHAVSLKNGRAAIRLLEKSLAPGVNRITLYSASGVPLAERLVFRHPGSVLAISLNSLKNTFNAREQVQVQAVLSALQQPDSAMLSMAVYRVDDADLPETADIRTSFFLGSELNGFIESPDYYLSAETPATIQAVDNLMLTQGWRSFRYKKLNSGAGFESEAYGHIASGKVIDNRSNQPAAGIMTYLTVPGNPIRLYTSVSDSLGRIRYELNEFYGAGEIIVQTDFSKDSVYRIEMDDSFSGEFSTNRPKALVLHPGWREYLKLSGLGMQIQHIYSGDKLNRLVEILRDTAPFYRKPHFTYELDDYKRFSSMTDVIMEYVLPATIRRRDGASRVEIINAHDRSIMSNPLLLLDGVPVFNAEKVLGHDPYKIKRIDVLNTRYFQGRNTYEGILSLMTYRGDLDGYQADPRALVMGYDGLQAERIFYAPVYDTPESRESRIPDNRNLLWWNPGITMHQSTHTEKFYSSDQPGNYIVVLQGIDSGGNAGSASLKFTVTAEKQHP